MAVVGSAMAAMGGVVSVAEETEAAAAMEMGAAWLTCTMWWARLLKAQLRLFRRRVPLKLT